MTISERLQGLYKPGSFNTGETKIQRSSKNSGFPKLANKMTSKKMDTADNFSLKSVLSGKEKDSLQALFGSGNNSSSGIYGANKLRSVQAGILLDIKG